MLLNEWPSLLGGPVGFSRNSQSLYEGCLPHHQGLTPCAMHWGVLRTFVQKPARTHCTKPLSLFSKSFFSFLVMKKTGLIIFNNILRKWVVQLSSRCHRNLVQSVLGARPDWRLRLCWGSSQESCSSHKKAIFWLVFIKVTRVVFLFLFSFPLLLLKAFDSKADKEFCSCNSKCSAGGWRIYLWSDSQLGGKQRTNASGEKYETAWASLLCSLNPEIVLHMSLPSAEFPPRPWRWRSGRNGCSLLSGWAPLYRSLREKSRHQKEMALTKVVQDAMLCADSGKLKGNMLKTFAGLENNWFNNSARF